MATKVQFKRNIKDAAKLEEPQEIAIGTTGFAGDGDRMFVQVNGAGILLSHDDARALLNAAQRIMADLGYDDPDNGATRH